VIAQQWHQRARRPSGWLAGRHQGAHFLARACCQRGQAPRKGQSIHWAACLRSGRPGRHIRRRRELPGSSRQSASAQGAGPQRPGGRFREIGQGRGRQSLESTGEATQAL